MLASLTALHRTRPGSKPARPLLAFALMGMLLWLACGGGGGGAPAPQTGTLAGTYALTITGTAAGVSRTSSLTLKVN